MEAHLGLAVCHRRRNLLRLRRSYLSWKWNDQESAVIAQRVYFIKCNPGKNAHHQLPTAKMKLFNVLNPKIIISRTIFVGHQGVLVD